MNKLINWATLKLTPFVHRKTLTREGKAGVQNIFVIHIPGKGLRLYKELQSINKKQEENQIGIQAKYLNNHFTKGYTQIVNKHITRCSTVTKKMQMKSTM